MIRTLHTYLARELLRVASLALLAFTIVLTVFAVMEPMRKQGLAPGQVAALFVYTLPVMLSLTMPVAALFATTIVYGRFSQDNEFLACRASGISTTALLMPAFTLGAVVTVASLALSFLVTPHMVAQGARAAKTNIRDIVYHKLRAEDCASYGPFDIHADLVDPRTDTIRGIVVADRRNSGHSVYAASTAYCRFGVDDRGRKYATFQLLHVARMQAGARDQPQPEEMLVSVPLPDVLEERPSWYDWTKLWQTLRNPVENEEVRRSLRDIRGIMAYDILARRVAEAIGRKQAFDQLRDEEGQYVMRAARAVPGRPGQVSLMALPPALVPDELEMGGWPALGRLARDSLLRVEILQVQDGDVRRIITGDLARVSPTVPTAIGGALAEMPTTHPLATVEVTGNVELALYGQGQAQQLRPPRWITGRAPIPQQIAEEAESIDLADIYQNPEKITPTRSIHALVNRLRDYNLARLRANILSELNARTSYCLSCFLMVCLGAALGLVFRGGHLISAFALSMAPAGMVIVTILMGKEMMRNRSASFEWGVISIWASLGALLIANVLVYGRLVRR